MLKIGEFSKLSRISVRMLRHYDEIGLLKPAEIDRFTDYRYYREDQLPTAGVSTTRAASMNCAPRSGSWCPRRSISGHHAPCLPPISHPRSGKMTFKLEAYYLRGVPWGPARYALDLFGDGSVVSVLTKGHTFGSCTTMLTWNGKKLLLAGNAVRSGRTFEDDRVYHRSEQEKTVRWLRETAGESNCLGILATHDPEEHERVIEL